MKDLAAKLVAIVMITALTLSGVVPSFASGENKKEAPEVTGTSAILIDAGTGQILYEKNSREKRDPASITKILNCLVVLENMDLDSEVKVPYKIEQIGNNIDLKKGEVLTVEQLLYAMMVCSANDAAEILAVSTGGSIEEFCRMMNERAAECGAENTNFTNPNGLNGWG
ncbi:MAG: D-alanyl-D-alanine carboxypeptidase family protein, partial [Anaerovoracaceae bacterium]